MNHLVVITAILFSSVSFSEIKTDDSFSTSKPPSLNEISAKDEKSDSVISDTEAVLRKWRIMERILQDGASSVVRSIFPLTVSLSEKVNMSSQCSSSILKMIFGIKKMKAWAFKMIDASGKIPNGLLTGFITSLGDFEGCLSVDVLGSTPFRGQYCTVFINPPVPKSKPFHKVTELFPEFVNFTKKGTVFDEMSQKAQYFIVFHPRTAVCVPSTCSREEIISIINTLIVSVGFPWNVSVSTCNVIEPVILSKGNIAIICVLSIIVLLVLSATTMDVYLNMNKKEERAEIEASSTTVKCLMSFSAYKNTLKLLEKNTSPDSIKIFYGMKVVSVLWVALVHSYIYTPMTVVGGYQNIVDSGKQFAYHVILNGFFSVQAFFFMSATLVAYGRMKFVGDHVNVTLYILLRLWRVTPTFMLVIAASMMVPHMGSGPLWKEIVENTFEKCKQNWWTNLVYINNFLPRDKMCFDWLWYIPADIHLYILALLVIVPLKSRPKLAFGINGLLFLAGTIVTAAAHVYYKQKPTLLFIYPDIRDSNYFLEKGYYRTYLHIQSYCIGLFTGYVLATVPKFKIPKVLNICGWLISVTLGLLVVYGIYDWNQGNVPGMEVSTLYASFNKVVWNLALSYVTIACYTGNGGIVTSLLSWSPLVPLSRLTFCFYIVHPIIHLMYIGSLKTLLHGDHKTIVYIFCGNIVLGYMVAYVVSLMFESPFICLSKIMLYKRKSSNAPEQKEESMSENNDKWLNKTEVSVISMKKIENVTP